MSAKRKTAVGVIFGGRSVEHDVSVVTGHQVMQAFDPELYEVVPIYIDREGRWFSGDPLTDLKSFQNEVVSLAGVQDVVLSPGVRHHGLIVNPTPSGMFAKKSQIKRLDVVFPALHGSHGEDGTMQGLLELADIPYVGCGVLASAIANDKVMTKIILRQYGIPVVDAVSFTRAEWERAPEEVIHHLDEELTYPVFIKPATLGSSIGIGWADNEALLRASIDVAMNFDRRVLVESAVVGGKEINCAVMGDGDQIRASVLEQPVSWDDFLTFEEKYLRGDGGMKSAERLIPAPLDEAVTAQIQGLAVQAFQAIDGRGTARIDFLMQGENVFLNEINTLPGSMAFYLWQESVPAMSPREVVHHLIELARTAHAEKRRSSYNYQTGLIAQTATRGLKGMKGAKNGQVSQAENKP